MQNARLRFPSSFGRWPRIAAIGAWIESAILFFFASSPNRPAHSYSGFIQKPPSKSISQAE